MKTFLILQEISNDWRYENGYTPDNDGTFFALIVIMLAFFLAIVIIAYTVQFLIDTYKKLKNALLKFHFFRRLHFKPRSEEAVDKIVRFARRRTKNGVIFDLDYYNHPLVNLIENIDKNLYPFMIESINERIDKINGFDYDLTKEGIMYGNNDEEYLIKAKEYVITLSDDK